MTKAANDGEKEAPNPVGRPPLFKTPQELQNKVDEYFESIKGVFNAELMQYTEPPQNATVTGLSLYLGFSSRQSMFDYQAKPEFIDIIKKARSIVEMGYENHLFSKTPTGAIFALKNMGWSDKKEVEHSGDPNHPVIVTGMRIINE